MALNPLYIRVPQTSTDVVDDFHLSKRVPIYGFRHGFMTCLWMAWNAHFDLDHPNDSQNPVCESWTSCYIHTKYMATYEMNVKYTTIKIINCRYFKIYRFKATDVSFSLI